MIGCWVVPRRMRELCSVDYRRGKLWRGRLQLERLRKVKDRARVVGFPYGEDQDVYKEEKTTPSLTCKYPTYKRNCLCKVLLERNEFLNKGQGQG